METSILIAKLLGPFYLLVGLGVLLNRPTFEKAAVEIEESPGLFYLSAIIAYAFGAVIVAVHNVWTGWPTLLTLLGWAGLLKGALRIAAPEYSRTMVARLVQSPNTITGTGLVSLALGAYLTAQGFWLAV